MTNTQLEEAKMGEAEGKSEEEEEEEEEEDENRNRFKVYDGTQLRHWG